MLTKNTYFFIGIGGIGMSALARYCFLKGMRVGGYDATASSLTKELAALGMEIYYEDKLSEVCSDFLVPDEVQVVYTPAVPTTTQLFSYYKNAGFHMQKRAALLGDITRDSFSYAVGGTHGKTTTSCLLAYLLDASGVGIAAFLGGISNNFKSNLLLKDTAISVVEADEFDRSFLQLSPNLACITGTDADHLDIYETKEALLEAFEEFSHCLKPSGQLFVHESVSIPGTTYGLSNTSDYYLSHINYSHGDTYAHIHTPHEVYEQVLFPMPGTHNLLNALVAFAMAYSQGIPGTQLVQSLGAFKGVQRRMSFEIKQPNKLYIDDYAHHPTAINAVYETLKDVYPNEEFSVIFQPHLYSRTQDFMEEFAQSLSAFKKVYLLPIYPAREAPIAGVSSEVLLEKISAPDKRLITLDNLVEQIQKDQPKALLTLGAGDIGLSVEHLKNALL